MTKLIYVILVDVTWKISLDHRAGEGDEETSQVNKGTELCWRPKFKHP